MGNILVGSRQTCTTYYDGTHSAYYYDDTGKIVDAIIFNCTNKLQLNFSDKRYNFPQKYFIGFRIIMTLFFYISVMRLSSENYVNRETYVVI